MVNLVHIIVKFVQIEYAIVKRDQNHHAEIVQIQK